MTVKQAAEAWGVTSQRVRIWIKQGRIPGAYLQTNGPQPYYLLPFDATKPEPRRRGRARVSSNGVKNSGRTN